MLPFLLACTPDDDAPGKLRQSDPGETDDTGTPPVADGCRATPAPADRDRVVAVSLPYDEDAGRSNAWALLVLTADGELRDDGARVEMGRGYAGEVVFTPDGSLGLVAQEDGTVGVFSPDGEVISTGVDGFYASRVVMDPSGEVAWVIDGNWVNNGGGVYRLPLDCETGEPGEPERVVEAKLPADLLLTGEEAVLVGLDVEGAEAGDDAALLTWGDDPAFVDGADAFGDDDAIVSDATLFDGFALIADNSEFSGVPTRVAVLAVGEALEPVEVVQMEDPVALLPAGDLVLVLSGYGDAVLALARDGDGFTSLGEVAGSALPGAGAVVSRGPLAGRVLVAEVEGIRMLRVTGEDVEDLGLTTLGAGYTGIPGAIGVQP
ncbi:MAG: hypothetical protein ACOZNI_33485 [Myxococcota bacterium]